MVTPSGRLPSVRYSPRGSNIEGKPRDPNVCFRRELRVARLEKRPALLVQERPCKPSRSTLLPQWHVCATQMLAPRREPIEIRSGWSSSFRLRFLQGTTFSHWDPILPWWALKTFERLSSIIKVKFWAVLTQTGCIHFFLGSIERTFMFIRQTQPFLKRFCKWNIFESFWENCHEKVTRTKSWGLKRRKVLIMMQMTPQDHPSAYALRLMPCGINYTLPMTKVSTQLPMRKTLVFN